MPLDLTFGELRKLIEAEGLGWVPSADRPDSAFLPKYSLGASEQGRTPTAQVPPFDQKGLGPGSNPFVAVRRVERKLVTADEVGNAFSAPFLKRLGLDEALETAAGRDAAMPEGGTPPPPAGGG